VNARALTVWSASALTITLSTDNPVYRGLVVVAGLNVLVALRRPGTRLRPTLLALCVAALTAMALTLLLSHTGAHALVTLPGSIPIVGGGITLEALVFGATTGLGIAAAVVAAAPLSLALEGHQLVDALPSALSRTGAAIATAVNLIPGVSRSAHEIRDAQRMRGWRAAHVSDWPEIAVPIVLTAMESSVSLAEAMEARGYGVGRRTHFQRARWQMTDLVAAVLAVAAAFTFVALRITGLSGAWYPFPSLTVPPLDPLPVVCCVALIVPALLHPHAALGGF
jgi:energy-coupling factor transport system permease protein